MLGIFENIDRYKIDNRIEPIDVIMMTLDAETFLEKCLDSLYREVPVKRLIVCDGASKDKTVEILNKYPRTEVHIKPDIKTYGKGIEFLLSLVETDWFVFPDSDVEFPLGWFDEMSKYKDQYDFFECKRIVAYEFKREVPYTIDQSKRALCGSQIGRKAAFANYHCDDDYIWRASDLYTRQQVEKDGFKYGKVQSTFHFHHTTDNHAYASDPKKSGSRMEFDLPKRVFLRKDAWKSAMLEHAKAVAKYLDPNYMDYKDMAVWLRCLDKEFIVQNNPAWLPYFKRIKRFILIKNIKFALTFSLKYFFGYYEALKNAFAEKDGYVSRILT